MVGQVEAEKEVEGKVEAEREVVEQVEAERDWWDRWRQRRK